ncbi:uncharacterized protein PHALS_01758 [Plasmopara halstedii]|uniref:Uncharacterized protein n=1 Tax=Plasmopara halstedii TaxID=4781 RepID=A0A0P1AU59_PLAHL|nr:uncharacterized protein PHALS_01758 [Plasmopara halstedii]CEG45465.1 hypothetical protein PHALS_01758 [Plasmopara halstedii]|eukprot:XP_024581834.1 hypothetical protein PHALS_01758 [Plasmopara halstedii]
MVLDSTYKDLVFGQWIVKGFSPENILDIFYFAHKPVVIKVTDQLFLAESQLRHNDFLKALRKYVSEEDLDKMIPSQEFKKAFLEQVDGVRDDFFRILRSWRMNYALRKNIRPDKLFSRMNKESLVLENPDSPKLLWMLDYVVRHRKQSTYTDIDLFVFLISKLSFESLMKVLRFQWKYPRIKKLADDVLNSMFFSTTMLTVLAKSGVKSEEY